MKDTILVRQHPQASDMVELYSVRKTARGEDFVLWGVVHADMLDGLGFDHHSEDLSDLKLALETR
tara:strand:- start:1280 stop:1474 length:195 start_codon:yes stop_codon:yes gene_type:complete